MQGRSRIGGSPNELHYAAGIVSFCFYFRFCVDRVWAVGRSAPIYKVKFVNGVFVDKGTVSPTSPCPKNGPSGCGNGNSKSFYIKGNKGDKIRITLTSNTGSAVFSIFDAAYKVFKNGSAVTSWAGTLPSNGDFRVNVFTTKEHTPFKIKFTKL